MDKRKPDHTDRQTDRQTDRKTDRRTHFLSAEEMFTASMASLTAWVICPARSVCWPNLVFTADWEMNSCKEFERPRGQEVTQGQSGDPTGRQVSERRTPPGRPTQAGLALRSGSSHYSAVVYSGCF